MGCTSPTRCYSAVSLANVYGKKNALNSHPLVVLPTPFPDASPGTQSLSACFEVDDQHFAVTPILDAQCRQAPRKVACLLLGIAFHGVSLDPPLLN